MIQVGALDLVSDWHNEMEAEMLPVEGPLLSTALARIKTTLARGAEELSWKSSAATVDAYLCEATCLVKGAHDQLFTLKAHLRDIVGELESWGREPLFARKPKPMSVDEFEAVFKGVRAARYAAIAEGGKAIDRKLRESAALMRVPRNSPAWMGYVDFVQSVVIQGLTGLVAASLRRLTDVLSHSQQQQLLLMQSAAAAGGGIGGGASGAGANIGSGCSTSTALAAGGDSSGGGKLGSGSVLAGGLAGSVDATPLLLVELVMQGGTIRFVPEVVEVGTSLTDLPPLGSNAVMGSDAMTSSPSFSSAGRTLYAVVGSWVDSFYHAAAVFPRLDESPEGRYVGEVADDPAVAALLAGVSDSLARCEAACGDYRATFAVYDFLWNRDQAATFAAFCAAAYVPLPKSEEQVRGGEEWGVFVAHNGRGCASCCGVFVRHVRMRVRHVHENDGVNNMDAHDKPHHYCVLPPLPPFISPYVTHQIKAEADLDAEDIPPQPRVPDLAAFDAEITKYRDLAETIGALRTPTDIGFLRVNSSPAKYALASLATSWAALPINHLIAYVTGAVGELQGFIGHVEKGLAEDVWGDSAEVGTTVSPGNTTSATALHGSRAHSPGGVGSGGGSGGGKEAALQRVMTHIRDVRKSRHVRKAGIAPLRKAIALLKKHGVAVDALRAQLSSSEAVAGQRAGGADGGAVISSPPMTAGGEGGATPSVSSTSSVSASQQAAATTSSSGSSEGAVSPSLSVIDYLEGADLRVEACISATFTKKEEIFPLQTAEMVAVKARAVAFEDRVR